jgi:hypothetical protein
VCRVACLALAYAVLWRTLGCGPKMSAFMLRIPAALGGDSSEVAVALEVAGALCEKGDHEEAVRWLKRAADAAAQAGDSSRAATFTEVAGDFEAALAVQRPSASVPSSGGVSVRPSYVPPKPTVPSAPPPASAVQPNSLNPAAVGDKGLRVSVKTSVRDPNLLLLRPLPEGESPPFGTREGILLLPRAADECMPVPSQRPSEHGGQEDANGHDAE